MKLAAGLKLAMAAAMAVWLVACAQTPKPPVTPGGPDVPQPYIPPEQSLSRLPGWEDSDPRIALEAVRGVCTLRRSSICGELDAVAFQSPKGIKDWLEARFRAERVEGEGLLTAYFVPEYPALPYPTAEFSQAVRPKPDDLVSVDGALMTPPQAAGTRVAARWEQGRYVPYYSRAEIEARPVFGAEFYMRPEDYFFMQIQGSGFISLPDGTRVLAAYAANNGLPFVGIARVMSERGLLADNQTSGENIRRWLAENRGPVAQEIMNHNPRYAFFAIDRLRTEPLGAAGVPLPAGAAIAVDPAFHAYGELYWIDADAGTLKEAFPVYRRMVAALDTGGAIKGKVRADLYMGIGERAGLEAGRVRHTLRKWRIVPAY